MNQETLQELFVEQIRDIYDAEKQLVKALPKLAKAAENEDLAEGFRSHLQETQGHVARLEEVFGLLGIAAKGKPCKAMKGLVEEGAEAIEEEEKGAMRDLAMIAAAQRVEHYEISAYGTVRTLAEHLNMDDAVELLQQTENEEKEADSKLTEVAVSIYGSADEEEEGEEADTEDEVEMASAGAGRSGRASSGSSSAKRGNASGNRKGSR